MEGCWLDELRLEVSGVVLRSMESNREVRVGVSLLRASILAWKRAFVALCGARYSYGLNRPWFLRLRDELFWFLLDCISGSLVS